jgi:hypothetical protein
MGVVAGAAAPVAQCGVSTARWPGGRASTARAGNKSHWRWAPCNGAAQLARTLALGMHTRALVCVAVPDPTMGPMPRRPPSAPQAGEHVLQLLYCSRKTSDMDEAALTDLGRTGRAAQCPPPHQRHAAGRLRPVPAVSGRACARAGRAVGPAAARPPPCQGAAAHEKPARRGSPVPCAHRWPLLYPATPLQFMALARDVRAHMPTPMPSGRWTPHELAARVDRSARRRERAEAADSE